MNLLKKQLQLFLLLVLASPVNAQLNDIEALGSLGGLAGGLSSVTKDEPILPEDSVIEDDSIGNNRRNNSDLVDDSFGYNGGDTFSGSQTPKSSDKPLKLFGYDFFTSQPTTFALLKNIPVPEDYLMGPGDNVKVLIYGNQNSEFTVEVTREGDILFPNIGRISVAGLTFSEMKETISQVVSREIIGAEVNISLGTLRTINIFILGDAFQPGMFTVSGLSTLTNAIFVSGGVSLNGSLRNIELKRNGKTTNVLDFYDLLLKGDTSKDIRLRDGDVIFIPPKSKSVAIVGEVARPGIYELRDSENLNALVAFAGNLKPEANAGKIEIQRIDQEIDAYKLLSAKLEGTSETDLKNGDYISIFPVNDTLMQSVLVKGHALNPGFYPWYEGIRISDIFSSEEDLLSMTDMDYLLIKRKKEDSQNYEYHQAGLNSIFQDLSLEENIQLNEKDEIILLPSLLSPEQITTRLIQQEFVIEDNKVLRKDEWQSLTYLRKSLLDETNAEVSTEETAFGFGPEGMLSGSTATEADSSQGYYEYSIFDYCILPKGLAIKVVESSGFDIDKKIALKDLAELNTPQELMALQDEIQSDIAENKSNDGDTESIDTTITSLCREQLIDPYIRLIDRQIDKSNKRNSIEIQGNVHFPGRYPLVQNMTIEGAINAGGGLKDSSYSSEIELSRSVQDGAEVVLKNTYYSASVNSQINTDLLPLDVINVKQMNNDVNTAEITGEVLFPGVYRLSANETLLDLIKRAGGLKPTGSIEAAYFQRESIKKAEQERLSSAQRELRRKIALTSQSVGLGETALSSAAISQITQLITADNPEDLKLGRLIIDLGAVLEESQELVLEDGDSLFIPKQQQTVSVLGEVYVSNSHIHKENFGISDYINLSGGTNEFADLEAIYLMKADGTILLSNEIANSGGFFRGSKSQIQPGDAIVVPVKLQPFNAVRASTEITQIIYQMALAAAAVNSF